MKKGKRRSTSEVRRVQEYFVQAIRGEGKITLTELIVKYGGEVGVKNTPTDKNLVKRQLDRAAQEGKILFQREGRDLVARARVEETAAPAAETTAPPVLELPKGSSTDLAVIRAYALQLEEFSRILQEQISTLVRMVEKAAQR